MFTLGCQSVCKNIYSPVHQRLITHQYTTVSFLPSTPACQSPAHYARVWTGEEVESRAHQMYGTVPRVTYGSTPVVRRGTITMVPPTGGGDRARGVHYDTYCMPRHGHMLPWAYITYIQSVCLSLSLGE